MKKAFSLIELLLVLSIISMIMGTMKAHVQKRRLQADAKSIVEKFYVYYGALTMYYLRNRGTFPADANWKFIEQLEVLEPYYPKGFESQGVLRSKEYKDIFIRQENGDFAIIIVLYKTETTELREEIIKQLREFASADEQIRWELHHSGVCWYIWFYLEKKVGEDTQVYI